MESKGPVWYRVEMFVDRFEETLGDSVLLKAQWAIVAQDKKLLLNRESLIREQMNSGSYDALIAAMSRALERLSTDIVGGIRSVSQTDRTGK